MESNNNELYLVFIERINDVPNSKGFYEYDFFFSETPEIVWGLDWNQQCPSACNIENIRPDSSTYNEVKKIYLIYPLMCIQNNSCLSCQDMVDGIIACAWEDVSEYDEYPEPFRFVFKFGQKKEEIEDLLAQRSQFFVGDNSDIRMDENEE